VVVVVVVVVVLVVVVVVHVLKFRGHSDDNSSANK